MKNQILITPSCAALLAASAGLTPDYKLGFKRNGLGVDANGILWFLTGAYGFDFSDENVDCKLTIQAGRVLGRLQELEAEAAATGGVLRHINRACNAKKSMINEITICRSILNEIVARFRDAT